MAFTKNSKNIIKSKMVTAVKATELLATHSLAAGFLSNRDLSK